MRLQFVLALALQLVPIHAEAQRRGRPHDVVVRALVPVLVSVLDSTEGRKTRETSAWHIDAKAVSRPLRQVLRDAILTGAHGRAATASDTVANLLEVLFVKLRGDTAEVEVLHGIGWCRHGSPAESGLSYSYLFTRAGRAWQYSRRRPDVFYDPPAPPLPGETPPGCSLTAGR